MSEDGSAAVCMRLADGARARVDCRGAGNGWLHVLRESPCFPRKPFAFEVRLRPAPDWTAAATVRAAATTDGQLAKHGHALHVSVASLRRLGAFVSIRWPGVIAFPMRRREQGPVCGVRLRSSTGAKWSAPGSRTGLFVPARLGRRGPLHLPEGPSDAAALLDLGLEAVGRPNSSACAWEVGRVSTGRDVVLVVDRDAAGALGARALLPELERRARSVRLLSPPAPFKDVRDWVAIGAKVDDVLAAARRAEEVS